VKEISLGSLRASLKFMLQELVAPSVSCHGFALEAALHPRPQRHLNGSDPLHN